MDPGERAASLLRSSRNLVPTPSLFSAFYVFFGLQEDDFHVFEHDHITEFESRVGLATDHPDPPRRIIDHQRNDFVVYLRGSNLKSIVRRFIGNLT
jgi:hypothetical protein